MGGKFSGQHRVSISVIHFFLQMYCRSSWSSEERDVVTVKNGNGSSNRLLVNTRFESSYFSSFEVTRCSDACYGMQYSDRLLFRQVKLFEFTCDNDSTRTCLGEVFALWFGRDISH